MKLEYYGTVSDDGAITLPNRMRGEIAAQFRGKPIAVTVERRTSKMSDPQRRYYFGCIVASICEALRDWDPETGWTPAMTHEVLKDRFLPRVRQWGEAVIPATGEVVLERPTTTKLTKSEAEHYYELCRKWAAEMDILIPLPNEQAELFFENIQI